MEENKSTLAEELEAYRRKYEYNLFTNVRIYPDGSVVLDYMHDSASRTFNSVNELRKYLKQKIK